MIMEHDFLYVGCAIVAGLIMNWHLKRTEKNGEHQRWVNEACPECGQFTLMETVDYLHNLAMSGEGYTCMECGYEGGMGWVLR